MCVYMYVHVCLMCRDIYTNGGVCVSVYTAAQRARSDEVSKRGGCIYMWMESVLSVSSVC